MSDGIGAERLRRQWMRQSPRGLAMILIFYTIIFSNAIQCLGWYCPWPSQINPAQEAVWSLCYEPSKLSKNGNIDSNSFVVTSKLAPVAMTILHMLWMGGCERHSMLQSNWRLDHAWYLKHIERHKRISKKRILKGIKAYTAGHRNIEKHFLESTFVHVVLFSLSARFVHKAMFGFYKLFCGSQSFSDALPQPRNGFQWECDWRCAMDTTWKLIGSFSSVRAHPCKTHTHTHTHTHSLTQ